MQLRSKFTVEKFANHTNKTLKQSEQILSNRTSNEKIGIENQPVPTSVTNSNNQNRQENIPNEKDVSGNKAQEESATNLNR